MADDTDIFAEAERRQRLYEQLLAASISDVSAVVGPNGPNAGRFRGEDLWTMTVRFEAWRVDGGEIQKPPLTVRQKVTDEELRKLRDLILPYNVIRIKARVVADSDFGGPQALLEAYLRRESSDEELNHIAEELQRPVTMEDPLLGAFSLDRQVDWFTGRVAWVGESIALNPSGSAEAHAALQAAHALWDSQSEWNRRVRDFAVEKLLPLKNDAWLDEDEDELTPEEFKDRMTLEAITVYGDGSFEFWHNDGDLFWGHAIQISGDLSAVPTDADIPG